MHPHPNLWIAFFVFGVCLLLWFCWGSYWGNGYFPRFLKPTKVLRIIFYWRSSYFVVRVPLESKTTLLIWNLLYHEHRDWRFEPTLEIYLKMLKMKIKISRELFMEMDIIVKNLMLLRQNVQHLCSAYFSIQVCEYAKHSWSYTRGWGA